MEMNSIPIPDSGETPDEALFLLAGAVDAALTIRASNSLNEETPDEWLILYVAFEQYANSNFFIKDTEIVRDKILSDFKYEYEKS